MEQEDTRPIETPTSSAREVREVTTTPHTSEVHRTVVPRAEMDHVDSVAYDPYEGRRIAAIRLQQLVYWVFGLIEGLIVIRLVLKALGANPAAGFSQFIYGITAPLVAPFIGLFSNPAYQGSLLELGSIVGLIVYALVAWLIARLVWILMGETRSAIHTHATQIDSHV